MFLRHGSSRRTKRSGSRCRCCCNYAGTDERVNAGIPDFRAALDSVGVPYSLNMYPGTQHGFHNDSSAARYNEPAAKLAWSRTLDFFETYLKNSNSEMRKGVRMKCWAYLLAGVALCTVAIAEEDIASRMTINKETNGTWYFQPDKPKAKHIKAARAG